MNINKIYNEDCQEGIKRIPDASVDCILTDPPYLYLKGQKLERPFDERTLFLEFARVLKPTGFIVLFGRGSSFYRWNTLLDMVRIYNGKYGYLYEFNGKRFFNDIEIGIETLKNPLFKFKEEIIWDKRYISSPVLPLSRIHETIAVFTRQNGSINKVKIPYMEMKKFDLEGILQDLNRMKSVLRNPQSLNNVLEFLKNNEETINNGWDERPAVRRDYMEATRPNNVTIGPGTPSGDRCVNAMQSLSCGMSEKSIIRVGREHYKTIHPTQKPVRLLERLLALVTQPGDVVLDPFSGSCSTAVACINTNREYIGFEIDKEYYEAGIKRLNEILAEPKLAM